MHEPGSAKVARNLRAVGNGIQFLAFFLGNEGIEYRWRKLLAKTIERKSRCIEKVDDVFVGLRIDKS